MLEEDSSLIDEDEDFFKEKPPPEEKAKVSVAKKITHDSVFKEVTMMQAEVNEICKKTRYREN